MLIIGTKRFYRILLISKSDMSEKNTTKTPQQEKADRLGQALRENLRKRKAQARVRSAGQEAAVKQGASDTTHK